MRIISWDVGVIHLAYCVLEYKIHKKTGKMFFKIIDWDEINLIEDDRIRLTCCGKMKAKKGETPKICGKNASYYFSLVDKHIGFCKAHLSQHIEYWSEADTKKLFKVIYINKEMDSNKINQINMCNYVQKNNNECGKKTKYLYDNGKQKLYYCTAHYKSEFKKKIKEFSPQPIKNLIVKKYPTSELQLNLFNKLDNLIGHFSELGISEVVIENQPSQKNPKMKSIANSLFDYFMIRGHIDKTDKLDIKLVRFICPSNKLKVNKNNTLEIFKKNKNEKKKYKLTKELGIKYTKQLLFNNPEQLEYLDLFKKQDDLCDAYLQGRYYLQYLKPKSKIKPLGGSGSKFTKKSLDLDKLMNDKRDLIKIKSSNKSSNKSLNKSSNKSRKKIKSTKQPIRKQVKKKSTSGSKTNNKNVKNVKNVKNISKLKSKSKSNSNNIILL